MTCPARPEQGSRAAKPTDAGEPWDADETDLFSVARNTWT